MKLQGSPIWWVLLFVSTAVGTWSISRGRSTWASTEPTGQTIFASNCAGCHSGGRNLMMPDKPVIGSKKLTTKTIFREFLLKPTGGMSSFPSIAKKDADLSALYTFCKSLK